MLAAAGGVGGAVGQFPLEQWFWEMPVCTRWWTTATVATSILVQCQIITPFQLFYSFRSVFVKNQVSVLRYPPMLDIHANMEAIVLAPSVHFLLLRPSFPRSHIPRLLSSALLSPARRVLRALSCSFLMVTALRDIYTSCYFSFALDALSRPCS